MIESVEEYLTVLKYELGDSDPAIAQDALSDAEEHLRTALESQLESNPDASAAEALAPIIAKYGTPKETADAYLDIEARLRPSLTQPASRDSRSALLRFVSVVAEPRAWGALIYMFFSLVGGVIYFTWALTGLSLSLGFLILIIGIPFTVFFLLSIRTIALVEGRVIEALLGVRMPHRSVFTPSRNGWWDRFKSLFVERQTWSGLAYMLLQFPLGTIYFTLFFTLTVVSGALIAAPFAGYPVQIDLGGTVYVAQPWMMPFVVVGGAILFLATMHLAKLIGRAHGALAKALLLGAWDVLYPSSGQS